MRNLIATFDIDGATNTVATDYVVYTTPSNNDATVDITLTNRHATVGSDLNVAIVPNGAVLGPSHYLEFTTTLAAKTSRKITNVKLSELDTIVVNASAADVNIVVNGTYQPEDA